MKTNDKMVEAPKGATHANLPKNLSALALIFATCVFSAQPGHAQIIPHQYIVLLKPGNAPADVANSHALERRQTYLSAVNGFAAAVPDGRLRALQNDPRVEFVEPDQQVFAFAQTIPVGIRRIAANHSPTARIDGFDDRVNVDVALIDSGIDLSHPDLNVLNHVTFINDGSGGNDGYGHGTYVAGIVGALDNDSGVVGVAPGARLWAVKVLSNSGVGSVSTLISGVDYVNQNAASIEVANISAGFSGTSSSLRSAIQSCVAKGVVMVAAAGNNSRSVYGADGNFNTSDDTIPAAYPEVIAVSSLNDNDGKPGGLGGAGWDDTLAFYSNFGPEIDLAAPGTTSSTALMSKGGYGSQYTGTSLAAAHVSGAAALYIAGHSRAANAEGVNTIKQALLVKGEPQSAWGPANTLDPDAYHEPLLHVVDASSTAANTPPTVSIASPVSGTNFSSGAAVSFSGSAIDTEDAVLSANLTWTSSIDGVIGAGPGFTRTLSSGTHTVTASVTDSGGLSASLNVSFTIQSPPPSNSAPTIVISSPASASTFGSDASVAFSAAANDVQDGNLSTNLTWTSSLDGVIGNGPGFNRVLSSGAHTVTASVTDSGGLAGSASVSFTVQNPPPPNTAPAVAITGPLSGASFSAGANVWFTGSATDTQDGNLSGTLAWTSSLDGLLGTGSRFKKVLSSGTHTVTASVSDSGGLSGSASVTFTVQGAPTNTAPGVAITSPLPGASFSAGASVSFTGSATDTQDGNLSSTLAWTSSLDGQIGTGGSFTSVLSSGNHTVTASVTDSGGLSGSTSVTFTVQNAPTNTAPTVAITSPLPGAGFTAGASASFSGSAADVQDGVLSGNLVWTSTLDDVIGTGSTITRVLGSGLHIITASVTDSEGLPGSASVTITVLPPPPQLFSGALVGNQFRFSFNADPHVTYTVEFRDSLSGSWASLMAIAAQPVNTTIHITNAISSPERYFRVKTP